MTIPWQSKDLNTWTLFINGVAIRELHGNKEGLDRMLQDPDECFKLGIPEEYMFEKYELIPRI